MYSAYCGKKKIKESTSIIKARQDIVWMIYNTKMIGYVKKGDKTVETLKNYNDNNGVWAGIYSDNSESKKRYDVTADGTLMKWRGENSYQIVHKKKK